MREILVFRPRPSYGWAWMAVLGLLTIALIVGPAVPVVAASPGNVPPYLLVISLVLGLGAGGLALALAAWFPTMRYELGPETLTLRYGPVLRYRIPISEIQSIRRRDLSASLWSSVRVPGLALFTVPYGDVGNVRMCATAMATGILLVETGRGKYGLTPADEEQFVAALKERMGN